VVIVGGGIAGLSAAWELTGGDAGPNDDSPRVELIEASDHLGGALVTTSFAGRTIDLGADGFLARRPEAVNLVRELGLGDQLEAINASGASIWLNGSLDQLPEGLVLGIPVHAKTLSSVKGLSWKAKLAARRDEWLPRRLSVGDDATIGTIVRTKLGPELTYRFIEPMIGGIQAGRIDDLSAKSIFPGLLDAARKGGSLMKALRLSGPVNPGPASTTTSAGPLFYSLLGGVGSLPLELARQLSDRGVVLRTGVPVSAVRSTPSGTYPWEVDTPTTSTLANSVIFATPAPLVAKLIGDLEPGLKALEGVKSAGAAMVTFDMARSEVSLPATGTGILVPLATMWSGEGSMMVTAVTFLDRKWPRLVGSDDVVLRAHVGRIDDSRWAEMTDDELTERVTRELRILLAHFGDALETRVQRWPDALPQYYLGHDRLVHGAKESAQKLGVALCGSAYDGVGIPASIGSGRRAAREVLASL
jgi:oxygen-dependent protoporphyrinogen oxidase